MESTKDLSIIILSYNTKDLLRECLQSVFEKIKSFDFEVIVVDNASKDDSVEVLKKDFSHITLIESEKNVGFGNGINLGASKANGKYLLFLNSDTKIVTDDFRSLIQYFEHHKKVGVIGGRIEKPDGQVQESAKSFYTLAHVFSLLFGGERVEREEQSDSIHEADWVEGSFLVISKEIFDKIGGFDKHIFMYTEDMELCYRVRKAGYSVVYFPSAVIQHVGQGSSNREFAIVNIYKGLLYFYKKHRSYREYVLVKLLLLVKAYMAIIIGLVTKKSSLTTTYKKAIQF